MLLHFAGGWRFSKKANLITRKIIQQLLPPAWQPALSGIVVLSSIVSPSLRAGRGGDSFCG